MATDLPGILIVDDNEDNRYTLQLMLESDGHERIASAAGGNEAIALIEKEKVQSHPPRSDDAGFERGRGSQSHQKRS
jgi:CheY-like chemotaxis protein